MRILRSLAFLLSGSLSLICAAQQPTTEPVLTAEQRTRLLERLADLLDEEGRRIGDFTAGGAGFRVADTDFGTLNFSAWAYARYLNQKSLDETYTDSFGGPRRSICVTTCS